ncbi:hypothetical protein D3C86_849290 [compost metagenome]
MKRRFLIPGHPSVDVEAEHIRVGGGGMVYFINGDVEGFDYDCGGYTVVAQFCAGVLILPIEGEPS